MSDIRGLRFSLVAFVVCMGCGSLDVDPPPSLTATYEATEESVLTPYPSDRYTVADSAAATGRRLAVANSDTRDLLSSDPVSLAELDQQDGFSIHGGVVLSFSGRPDIDTVARIGSVPDVSFSDRVGPPREAEAFTQPDSPLLLVDVDPASPDRGKARGLIVTYWEHDGAIDGGESEYTIIAQPARPLRPRTRYLFVATDRWRGDQGESVVPSARTKQLLAGEVEVDYGIQVAEGLALVEDGFGVRPGEVVLVTAFTTQSVHEELLAAASAQREMAAPKLLAPWLVETPVADDGRVRLRAVMEAPAYRAEDERFVIDDGVPRVIGMDNLEVFLAVADDAQTTRRPVVIYGHGLSGDKDGCWGTAQRLAGLGVAVFAIDAPHHGTRGGTTVNAVTSTTKFFGMDPDDRSFVIGRARDNFRQMALDQLTLVRLLSSLSELDVLPIGAPDGKPD
ncbi:MAG: hypothetical protein VB934_04300, partial [Polyangiaceae bacterium]